MRPFVSVIVPAYNEARYIGEQLEALEAQNMTVNGKSLWSIIVY
jgi:glycosyltransferase involved in cell wall biosynthesis